MARKGFVRTNEQAEVLQREIEALKGAGVPVQEIRIGASAVSLPEDMAEGDVLVLYTLGACGGLSGAAALLGEAAARGITVRTLREGIDTSAPPSDWASTAELFRELVWTERSERARASLRATQAEGHRRAGRPKPERLVVQLRKALAEYYATERSVREICTDAGVDASVLYRCIDKNGLPRRSAIAADPALAPFREGRSLHVTMNGKRCTITPPSGKAGRQGRRGRPKKRSMNPTRGIDHPAPVPSGGSGRECRAEQTDVR